jgi:hypothetical protein
VLSGAAVDLNAPVWQCCGLGGASGHCQLAHGSGCGCHDSGWQCSGCRAVEDDGGLGGSVSSLDSCALSGAALPAPLLQPAWAATAESAACLGATTATGTMRKPVASSFPSSGAFQRSLDGCVTLSVLIVQCLSVTRLELCSAAWPQLASTTVWPLVTCCLSVRRRQLGPGEQHPRLPHPGAGSAHARGAAAAAGQRASAGRRTGALLAGGGGDGHVAAARPAPQLARVPQGAALRPRGPAPWRVQHARRTSADACVQRHICRRR